MSCTGDFGDRGDFATQVLFGAPHRQGRLTFPPGRVFGVQASELTHAGRRVRAWLYVLQVPRGPGLLGEGLFRLPFVRGPVHLLCQLVQSRHHRRSGPVCDLLGCMDRLEERIELDLVPASFWLLAGLSAQAGMGVRMPAPREITSWSRGDA